MQAVPRGLRTVLTRPPLAAPRPCTRIRCAHTSTNNPSPSSSSQQNANSSKSTHFGFRTVPEGSKEALVRGVFDSVASSYDIMNDAMSFGVHRLWKDSFISLLRPGSKGPIRCIDVAGGTGDIALRILDHARETRGDRETRVDIVDINGEMLKEGHMRFKKTMYHNSACGFLGGVVFFSVPYVDDGSPTAPQVAFIEANAQELPLELFPDNTYDLYTIAFGIRNVTSIPDVLREAHRVLKPGGTFACLEFNKVTNPLLAQCVFFPLPPSSCLSLVYF